MKGQVSLNKRAIKGYWLFLTIVFWLAIFFLLGPLFWSLNPERVVLEKINLAPSWEHLWGTDQLGRDILSRTLAGGRISLSVGLLVSLVAVSLGTLIGLASGYWWQIFFPGIVAISTLLIIHSWGEFVNTRR